jgi:hypothetical protein
VAPIAILQRRMIPRNNEPVVHGSFTGWICLNLRQLGRMHHLSGRFSHPSILEVKDAKEGGIVRNSEAFTIQWAGYGAEEVQAPLDRHRTGILYLPRYCYI